MLGMSGWLLKTSYEHRDSLAGDVNKFATSVGSFFDTNNRLDPDKSDRIKIWVSL